MASSDADEFPGARLEAGPGVVPRGNAPVLRGTTLCPESCQHQTYQEPAQPPAQVDCSLQREKIETGKKRYLNKFNATLAQ